MTGEALICQISPRSLMAMARFKCRLVPGPGVTQGGGLPSTSRLSYAATHATFHPGWPFEIRSLGFRGRV
jgi:hypothetical protein